MRASIFHSRRCAGVHGLTRAQGKAKAQHGGSLIEVLVTMVILMVGLLGLVGLMVQAQRGQVESYQRIQALVVLQDMVGRVNANRKAAPCYVTATFVGTAGPSLVACATGTAEQKTRANDDLFEWQQLLLGSAETVSSGGVTSNVGAMIGARGCVNLIQTGAAVAPPGVATAVYRVTVAWQGQSATAAPPSAGGIFVAIPCASGQYGAENLRRVVYEDVQIVDLLALPL